MEVCDAVPVADESRSRDRDGSPYGLYSLISAPAPMPPSLVRLVELYAEADTEGVTEELVCWYPIDAISITSPARYDRSVGGPREEDMLEGWRDLADTCEAERDMPSSRGCRAREPSWNVLGGCFEERETEEGKGEDFEERDLTGILGCLNFTLQTKNPITNRQMMAIPMHIPATAPLEAKRL